AWDVLTELDQAAPRVIERTLGHPFVRVWASPESYAGRASAFDLRWLNAIALSAAVNAGRQVETLPLTLHDGRIHLPGLGTLRVPGAQRAVAATVPGGLRITAGTASYEIELLSN